VFRWWRLVWFGWGVAVGLAAGNLAIAPSAANRASSARPGLLAPDRGYRSEVAAAFALTPLATPLPTVSNLKVAVPTDDGETGRTRAPTAHESSGIASLAAEGERLDESPAPSVEADDSASGVETLDLLADTEDEAATEDGPDAASPGAAQPAQSGVTTGTIRDPVRARAWALRAAPSPSARTLLSLTRGTRVQILPDTASGSGFTWLRVRTQVGVVGWVVADAILR